MPFKDILKKKEKVDNDIMPSPPPQNPDEPEFQFTFMRSDTHTQEIISPPSLSSRESASLSTALQGSSGGTRKSSGLFKSRARTSSTASASSVSSRSSDKSSSRPEHRRLSQRLGLRKSVASSASVPDNLPDIAADDETIDVSGIESRWEARATLLAKKNERSRSRPTTPVGSVTDLERFGEMTMGGRVTPLGGSVVSSKNMDDNIQEAIRLHEAGELEVSTQMFGRLADPHGENNALSQVLYGLALRHGWGCTPNPSEAVTYLSAAASNAASIEELALEAGMAKGGAAKGELVLAIFELANCFRHGWGVKIDKLAAKQYYETAANLGDTDAMNEVAWCYLEGFGCKKDKYAAAKYYRLAEKGGSKTLGNTWIWKEKYDRPQK